MPAPAPTPQRPRFVRARLVVVVLAAVTLAVSLALPPQDVGEGAGGAVPQQVGDEEATAALAGAAPGSALEQLASLTVAPDEGEETYQRESFGAPWADVDRNGCDTRDDVLARDLVGARRDDDRCEVSSGLLHDPYSGRTLAFERGTTSSGAVQIDHVVALSDAWRSGASSWSRSRRLSLANDPLNLLAVDGPLNEEKSGSDASGWLPPATAYRCPYVARQIAVKARYGLRVTESERSAMIAALLRCG